MFLLTTKLHEARKREMCPGEEFRRAIPGWFQFVAGNYAGVVHQAPGNYHLMEFKEVLQGNNRVMQILIPALEEGNTEKIIGFREKEPDGANSEALILEKTDQGEYPRINPAVLIRERGVSLGKDWQDLHNAFLLDKTREYEPRDFFKILNIPDQHLAGEKALLCYLQLDDFSRTFTIHVVSWLNTHQGKWSFSGKALYLGHYRKGNPSFRYLQRKPVSYVLGGIGYLFTIALDIVTLPLQIIFLIILAIGWRK